MSAMYDHGVSQIMGGNIDLINDNITAILVDTTLYTADLINDEVQSDIPAAAVLSEKRLTGNTLDLSTFRADNTVFKSVQGNQVGAVVIIKDSNSYSTSPLLAYIDAPEFPITPDGSDVTITWDTGPDGIFTL